LKKRILYIILGVMLLSVKGVGQAPIEISGSLILSYAGFGRTPAYTVNSAGTPSFLYTDNTSGFSLGSTAPKNIGSYKVKITLVGGPDAGFFVETDYTIIKRLISITSVANTKNYDGTITASGLPTITSGSLGSGDVGTFKEEYDTKNQGTGKTLTPSVVSLVDGGGVDMTSNYTVTPVSTTNGIINKKLLTITVINGQAKIYGTTDPTNYPYALSAPLVGIDVLTGVLTRLAGESVGTYAITQGTLTNSNYDIVFVGSNFNITKATLTITAEDKSKLYGAIVPALTYTYSGLVNGDAAPSTLPAIITTALASSSVDSYPITVSAAADANYTINYVPGILIVNKVPLKITAENKTKVYGAANPTLTYTYSGLVNGDLATITWPTIITAALPNSPVGVYEIIPSAATDPNYTITYVNASLTVTKALLTITALAKLKVYGEINPTLTFAYTGLVNPDAAPSTLPTISTTALASSPVGSYPISISGASDANYTISYIDGILKIEKKEINVIADSQSKEYNTTDPPLTYTFSPSPLIGSDNYTGALIRSIGEVPGPYEINQGTLSLSSNYQLNFTKGILTIKPETIFFFEIPNAFVPGSSNDLDNKFRVFYNSAFRPELFKSLSIYNRNGQFIKRFDSITDSWDGRIDFVLQEADVYLWTVAFNPTINDNEKSNISKTPKSGTFILLK